VKSSTPTGHRRWSYKRVRAVPFTLLKKFSTG
jgi:hypothetical protein